MTENNKISLPDEIPRDIPIPKDIKDLKKLPKEVKKKFDDIKKKLDKFKKDILKKFDKYILSIALLPPSKENKKKINVLVLVDDSDSKKMAKYELKDKLTKIIKKSAEDTDKSLSPNIMLSSELVEDCCDGKYDILKDIALAAPIYDPKDMLAALKIAEVHKTMVIKKFEKYIVSYVAAGSLFRGEKSHDIDVYVIVDDTDVKRMSRAELKDKLRAIIISMGFDAKAMTGVDKSFHVQVYILTDFWDSLKEASPVIYTLLRDGVPLYDRGVFMPWKLLLKMGRVRPSKESIDLHMEIGDKLITRVKGKLLSIVAEDIFYAALNPAQAALMLYGLNPPTPKETIALLDKVFVKKEKILEKRYVNILEKIRQKYKDVEHGKIKEIKGAEIDKLMKDVQDYLKRIKKLVDIIHKKTDVNRVIEFYDACNAVVNDVLKTEEIKEKGEKGLKILVEQGKIPDKFLKTFKKIQKAKQDYKNKKLTNQEFEKIRRESVFLIKALTEYIQRKRGYELERAKIRVKYGDQYAEVLLLDKIAFIITDIDAKKKEVQKATIKSDGSLVSIKKSDFVELDKHISTVVIPKNVFIKQKTFDSLKKLFGDDIKILVSY